jgi:ABC-type sugar transport system ATPase subunit
MILFISSGICSCVCFTSYGALAIVGDVMVLGVASTGACLCVERYGINIMLAIAIIIIIEVINIRRLLFKLRPLSRYIFGIYILAPLYIKLGCYIITERDLIIHDLNKKYGNVIALKDINIEVERGSIAGILGPTGRGKTTLLKCIAGIEIPDSGEIYFGGNLVTSVKEGIYVRPEKWAIGMVFQSYALWPHMSVYENVAFPLKVRGLARSEIDRRVKEILSIVGLKGFERRYPHQLSGGQQQRVALARALVKEPSVLLLDEPFSNLDARIRIVAREFVKKVQKKLGITTILVTHDQADAFSVAGRIMVMNNGVLQQIGTPDEIYSSPANILWRAS